MRVRALSLPVKWLCWLAVGVAAGALGAWPALVNLNVPIVSPATGVAIACLLLLGLRAWPVVFLAALIAHAASGDSLIRTVALSAGSTLEALAGAALVGRWADGRDAFRRARNVIRFAAIVAVFAAPVGASAGVITRWLAGPTPPPDFATAWMTWWLSDIAGALVVVPFLLLWSMGLWGWRLARTLEAIALLALLVSVSLVIFAGYFPSDIKNYPLEFLVVPPLMWAAFSFGRREGATAVVIVTAAAAWGTLRGYGPFARGTLNESFLLVQAFVSVTAVMSVALAALVSEQKRAEEQARALSVTDPLTGLANYRQLNQVLRGEITRSQRTGRGFAVLFLDLDGLKRINDEMGHLAGNRALCLVGEVLQRTCRAMDTPARFGGDEFVVILPETDENGAHRLAERLSAGVAMRREHLPVAISLGVALYPRDGASPALLLGAADRALYRVKLRRVSQRAALAVAEPVEQPAS